MNMSKPFPLMQGLALVAVFVPAVSAQAFDMPDAGQTLQQLQAPLAPQPLVPRASPLAADDADKPASAVTPGSTRIRVASFRVEGSTVFPAAQLESLLDALVDSERTLDELTAAARQITRFYRHHGYSVARAYLPAQTVQNGEVVIRVLEGRLGRVVINNRSQVADERLTRLIEGQIKPGQLMDTGKVNRALLLAGNLPGVGRVQGALQAGEELGSTQLVVTVPEGRRTLADLSLDNTGSRFTGQYRLSGHWQWNNPLRSGDRLDLRATLSDQALAYAQAQWDTPLGVRGWRVGFQTAFSRYELAEQFAALDAHGDSLTVGLNARYPLVMAVQREVLFDLALEQRDLSDEIGLYAQTTDKQVQDLVLTLSGSRTQGSWAGAWRVSGTSGQLSIDPLKERQRDRLSARTEGGFTKAELSGSYLYTLSDKQGIYLSLNGQLASKNLDSSEKMLLGGIGGVRAYPSGEGQGDEGWQATAEWRYRVLPSLQGVLFYDAGAVDINHTPFAAGTNHRSLSGGGLGVNASPLPGLGLKMNVAWRGNEAPVSDKDQKPRVWLQASYQF